MDKISVIVPAYNVEKWLVKCVESILSQTYQNIEVILVDDGSTDQTPILCDELAKRDGRIRVVHKKNGGLSSARNAGIEIAAGEYLGFVDSDDYISPLMYEKMYGQMIENEAELAICSMEFVYECKEDEGKMGECSMTDEVLEMEEAYKKINPYVEGYCYYVTAPNKLYHKSIFENFRFIEGRLHEDEFAIHHIISLCNKVVITSEKFYYYLQRKGSITHSRNIDNSIDTIDAFFDRFRLLEEKGLRHEAECSLRLSYSVLREVLMNKKNHEYKKRLSKQVRLISTELLKRRNYRGIRAWMLYVFL